MENTELFITGSEDFPTPSLISELLEERRFAELKKQVTPIPAPDLANLLCELNKTDRAVVFRLLSKELAAETFVDMDADAKITLIESFNDSELSDILDELFIDDTVELIEEMPAAVVKRILKNTASDDRKTINRILNYPKDTAGSIMTTEYVRFVGDMTVEGALAHIRKVAIDKETIYTCYVTDRQRRLIGIVTAKDLLISEPETSLEEIMEENVISVPTGMDKEDVALTLDKYGFLALPVVDSENRLVGIVTVDDALEVLKQESEEDFAKMAAITPTETPYLRTSVLSIWRSRIPWLLLLMVSATFSSTIPSGFESALPAVLILFVPMLMDTGGNSGGQASVTVTRGISLMEIEFRDLGRVLFKELRVGVLCGATLGLVTFGKVMLVDRLIMGNGEVTVTVAFAVSVALAVSVIVAKIIGSVLPILAKRIGFDPAVMASPLITTLVDAIALILYFFIAKSIMGI